MQMSYDPAGDPIVMNRSSSVPQVGVKGPLQPRLSHMIEYFSLAREQSALLTTKYLSATGPFRFLSWLFVTRFCISIIGGLGLAEETSSRYGRSLMNVGPHSGTRCQSGYGK